MRCPKCGYNSFDYLDSCKKCGKDLAEHKQKFGIVSVLFPGHMSQVANTEVAEEENLVEEAVAAATTTVAPTPPMEDSLEETVVAPAEPATEGAGEGDDFGFDFMGDSEQEEDLSFDELFEEAPADEDVEESLPSPDSADEETSESLEVDEFDLPPADDNEFSFDDDNVEFDDEDSGTEEDPKDPFDLPESSQDEEAPEEQTQHFVAPDVFPEVAEELLPVDSVTADVEELLASEPVALEEPVPFEPISEAEPVSDDVATAFVAVEEQPETPAESQLPVAEQPIATAPSSEATPLPATGNRVAAFCCDLILLFVVGTCFVVAAEAAMSPASDHLLPTFERLVDLSVPYFLVLFSLAFGYFTLFHFLAGQTPGKMLAGLRVETIEGEPLLFSQAFLRSVGGLLQLIPGGLGYLIIIISPDRRGWNDRLAGTRLISLKGLPEEA